MPNMDPIRFRDFLEAIKEGIGILTLAPEEFVRAGTLWMIEKMLEEGIYPSAGHWRPTEEELGIIRDFAAGLAIPLMGTHLWNGTGRKKDPWFIDGVLAGNFCLTVVGDRVHMTRNGSDVNIGTPEETFRFGIDYMRQSGRDVALITDGLNSGGEYAMINRVRYAPPNRGVTTPDMFQKKCI